MGRWYHLIGTFDGTVARLFVDGVLVAMADAAPRVAGTDVFTTTFSAVPMLVVVFINKKTFKL